jgi:hypothetical protein
MLHHRSGLLPIVRHRLEEPGDHPPAEGEIARPRRDERDAGPGDDLLDQVRAATVQPTHDRLDGAVE